MKRSRADKVLLSTMPTPPQRGAEPAADGNSSSPDRASGEGGPQIAPGRARRWQPKENILQVAAATGRFETLGRAIAAAGLTSTLSEAGPFTLFAPTDNAFAKMPSADLRALFADKGKLHELLSYHLVPSKVRAPRHRLPSSVTTLG